MAELGAKKKQRNVLLDLLKVFCCTMAALSHYNLLLGAYVQPVEGARTMITILNEALVGQYQYRYSGSPILGMHGYITIGIFTFLTGYWFVDHFKRDQRKGLFGKGMDLTFATKYVCRNFSTYWPYVLFGTLFGMLLVYLCLPQLTVFSYNFIEDFIMAIPQMLGFKHMGFLHNNQYFGLGFPGWGGYADATNDFTQLEGVGVVTWNAPLWYMWALLVLLPFFYVIFMKNEAFGVFGLTSFLYMAGNTTMTTSVYLTSWTNLGIDDAMIRLGCPMALGVWGWYITDWLKKQEIKGKAKIALNIFAVISFLFLANQTIIGTGGFHLNDVSYAVVAILVLAGKDSVTTGINNVLCKIPGTKYLGTAALGFYLLHYPIADVLGYVCKTNMWPEVASFIMSLNKDQGAIIFIVSGLALCIPFYFVDKYVLRKLGAWFTKITKANEPVVIEAPEAK